MSEKNKRIYHTVLMILSIALMIGLVYYVHNNVSVFAQLKDVKLGLILFLILLHAVDFWLIGYIYQLPLSKHQISLNFKEWYGLSIVTELFNMVLPARGGTGLRMMYMKDNKSLSIREFFSINFSVVVIGFTLLGISGLLYSQFFLTKTHVLYDLLDSIFIALTVSGVLLMLGNEFVTKIFKIKRRHSPKAYLIDKRLSSLTALTWATIFLLYPLRIFILFKALGINLHIGDSIEISFILLLVSFFQVLPGNIGVKEVVTAYIGKQYGIEFETALLASLVDRALLVSFLFPLGMYYYWQLFLEATLPMPRLRATHQKDQASTIGANLTMNFLRLPSEKRIKTFSSAPAPSESSTFPAP
jgi:glycosyltransferase 2 family protein